MMNKQIESIYGPPWDFVQALSRHIKRPVSIFDLETSTCYGNLQCGITDFAIISIYPDGAFDYTHAHVNPEFPLDPEHEPNYLLNKTDFKNASSWPTYASFFDAIKDHLLCGFGITRYDLPVLRQQAKRYGLNPPPFGLVLDLMYVANYYMKRKTSLVHAANYYKVPVRERHLASLDTQLTTALLETMLSSHGNSQLIHFIKEQKKQLAYFDHLTYLINDLEIIDVNNISEFLGVPVNQINHDIVDLLELAYIDPNDTGIPVVQSWIDKNLTRTLDTQWINSAREVEPLYDKLLRGDNCPDNLDFVQIKTALMRHGL